MVKRYSHTAIITIATGSVVNGEWIENKPSEAIVKGQYFPDTSGQLTLNVDGNEKTVHGEFSTLHKPIENASKIRIDSIALDAPIIKWEPFQSHSVIYV